VAADVAAGGGDVGCSSEPVEADGQVAQCGHDGRACRGADLGVVFDEDNVTDPVQSVLDAPVPADCIGDLIGPDPAPGHVGDRVDGLGAPLVAGQRSTSAVIRIASRARGNPIPSVTAASCTVR
jgi:hypothetical protein